MGRKRLMGIRGPMRARKMLCDKEALSKGSQKRAQVIEQQTGPGYLGLSGLRGRRMERDETERPRVQIMKSFVKL